MSLELADPSIDAQTRSLTELMELMAEAPALYQPSVFWEQLGIAGLQQLQECGFGHFKRTINMRYFNWNVLGILAHQFMPVFSRWCRDPDWSVFTARFSEYRAPRPGVKSFSPIAALIYRLYGAMLWEDVVRLDRLGLLARVEEPRVGNPFLVRYKNRWISQDLCNSVHEFYSASGDAAVDGRPCQVAELGAGYGRLAYLFLKALPSCTYSIIDIPPALYIAERYLCEVVPGERVFRFRRFARYRDIQEEFEASRIRLLAAPQIALLPDKSFDLFLNISSLHEMTYAQIENYLQQIDRLCRGRFYMKQWRVSRAKVNGCVLRERDYPVPRAWTRLYHRRHPIQRMFFEALYQTGPAETGPQPSSCVDGAGDAIQPFERHDSIPRGRR